MSTCNRLDLQTLGSQLIMPKNLPDHCMGLTLMENNVPSTNLPNKKGVVAKLYIFIALIRGFGVGFRVELIKRSNFCVILCVQVE